MGALRLTYGNWQVVGDNAAPLNRGEEQSRNITVMYVSENGGMLFGNVTCTVDQIEYYVKDPTNPQNYNRYAYCLNNPLKYTDPSGEFIWAIAAMILVAGYDLLTNNWQGWEGSGKKGVMAGIFALGGNGASVT